MQPNIHKTSTATCQLNSLKYVYAILAETTPIMETITDKTVNKKRRCFLFSLLFSEMNVMIQSLNLSEKVFISVN